MNSTNLKKIRKEGILWVKENPDEALLCLIGSVIAAVVFTFCAFYFATKTPVYEAPEPLAPPKNWVFVERVRAGGGQVCDLYKRGEISKARCYGRNSQGKWELKNIF